MYARGYIPPQRTSHEQQSESEIAEDQWEAALEHQRVARRKRAQRFLDGLRRRAAHHQADEGGAET